MTRAARRAGLAAAVALHAIVFAAPWIAPYDAAVLHRETPLAPPTRIHFVDAHGRWHARPFVCAIAQSPATLEYAEDCGVRYPIRAFVTRTEPFGFTTRTVRRLFGADPPGHVFLLGTDQFGRDMLSRLLEGARVSIGMAIAATAIALALALTAGAIAGYAGGVVDAMVSAGTELVLALPWLYLLVAVRAALPLSLPPAEGILVIVLLLGFLGWARPGRLVRAVVATARERDYVAAARTAGASTPRILVRHVLPEVSGLAAVTAVVLIRQFVLAETALSLFGLGVPEPIPSWGSMLAAAQRPHALTDTWWLLAPVGGLIVVCVVYYGLARALRQDSMPHRL
jgi:peptide/nickel transport system permease protein